MSIVLLSTDSDVETGELPRDVWFKMAVSEDRDEIKKPHGKIAADGYRIHIDNITHDCECGDVDPHRKIEHVIDLTRKEISFSFAISKEFLLEALAGIEDDTVLFFSGGPKKPVAIQDREGDRAAVIMPVDVIKPTPKLCLPDTIGADIETPTPDDKDGMF
jgi:hypothetical protein